MKVKSLFIALMGLACVSEAYAASQYTTNNNYISGEAGISIPSFSEGDSKHYGDAKPKVGVPFGAEVGYRFSDKFGVGMNISYRSHKINQDTELDAQHNKDVKDKLNVNQKFSSILFMLNGKYSVCDFYGVKPYIMAGIGMNYAVNGAYTYTKKNTADDSSIVLYKPDDINIVSYKQAGKSQMKFSWNVGIGIEKELGNNFMLGLGYRFVDLGKRETGNEVTVLGQVGRSAKYDNIVPIATSLKVHEITLGLTYLY